MTVDELTTALREITDSEFEQVFDEMILIRQERQARPQVEAGQAQLVAELQEAGKLDKPEAVTVEEAQEHADATPVWQNPGHDHAKMYHLGDVVRYGNRLVRSTHAGLNHWEPTTLNLDGRIWEVVGTVGADAPEDVEGDGQGGEVAAPEPETPAAPQFRQPSGAHDAYKMGDRVTYDGRVYESTINANAYSPDAYPAGWRAV